MKNYVCPCSHHLSSDVPFTTAPRVIQAALPVQNKLKKGTDWQPVSHFSRSWIAALIGAWLTLGSVAIQAQVNSGSNGSDGAFNPTQNVTLNMADHPDGIYQYTSVIIPPTVTVTFTPNANNMPVVWLVQGDCTVTGTIDLSGKVNGNVGGTGGPGGFSGGSLASCEQGPGGSASGYFAGNALFATLGATKNNVE